MRDHPPLRGISPMAPRSKLVLPAPLGPRRATSSPARRRKEASSTRSAPPVRSVRPQTRNPLSRASGATPVGRARLSFPERFFIRGGNPACRDESEQGTSSTHWIRVGWRCSPSGVLKLAVDPSYRKMMWLEAGRGTPPPNSWLDCEICSVPMVWRGVSGRYLGQTPNPDSLSGVGKLSLRAPSRCDRARTCQS